MKIRFMAMLLGAAAFSTAPLLAQYPGQNADKMKVQTVVPFKALSFDYSDVHLLNGPFKTAMEIDQKWLKTADVDRFMHNYRVTAGLPSHAQAFGGWESLDTELRGHSLGHMLTALAEMYATTGDKQYKDKGTEFVKDLAECQTALGTSGYLSAFPEKLVDRAIAGQPVWAPWYTLHKIFAGLIDQYNICGNQQALDVAVKMGNWAYNKLNPLTHEQLQLMLREEFGGMEEAMYNLYAATGDKRFKELAEKTAGQRRPGAASLDLAYVACGRYDAFFEFGLFPWDFAAGVLLIQEAGGLVSDFTGESGFTESGDIVAGSPKIFAQLIQALAPHLPACGQV